MKSTSIDQHEFSTLDQQDRHFLQQELIPKKRKSFYLLSIISVVLALAMPYIPGRRTGPFVERMSYLEALAFFVPIFVLLILYVFYNDIYLLKRDVEKGLKTSFSTSLKRKLWKGHSEFQLLFDDLPKSLNTNKFKKKMYPAAESDDWQEGELYVFEYLKRSGTLLRIRKA